MITNDIQTIREKCTSLLERNRVLLSDTNNTAIILPEVEVLIALFDSVLRNKAAIKKSIKIFTLYQGFFSSIRKSRAMFLKIARKRSRGRGGVHNNNVPPSNLDITTAALWGLQAVSLFETRKMLQEKIFSPHNHVINGSHLRIGDIVLSYKTEGYLKKNFLAWLIAMSTNCQITHSLIVSGEGSDSTLFCSSPEQAGLGCKPPIPQSGEAYIILRPKQSLVDYPSLTVSIQKWLTQSTGENRHEFAELKSWMANFVGFIYLFSSCLTQRSWVLSNPAKNRSGIFCSELIDNIYKDIGIYLTPRSIHRALASPLEFFHSPYFDFQGIIVQNEDIDTIQRELSIKYQTSATNYHSEPQISN